MRLEIQGRKRYDIGSGGEKQLSIRVGHASLGGALFTRDSDEESWIHFAAALERTLFNIFKRNESQGRNVSNKYQ